MSDTNECVMGGTRTIVLFDVNTKSQLRDIQNIITHQDHSQNWTLYSHVSKQ